MADIPVSGSVIHYPYLWAWRHKRGETEGRKSRPVCLVLAIPKSRQTHLILLAISGTSPRQDQTALAIPQLECRRAGLRDWTDAWITVSEFNHDIAERSHYFDPHAEVLGSFSKGFLAKVALAFKPFSYNRMPRLGEQTDDRKRDASRGRSGRQRPPSPPLPCSS